MGAGRADRGRRAGRCRPWPTSSDRGVSTKCIGAQRQDVTSWSATRSPVEADDSAQHNRGCTFAPVPVPGTDAQRAIQDVVVDAEAPVLAPRVVVAVAQAPGARAAASRHRAAPAHPALAIRWAAGHHHAGSPSRRHPAVLHHAWHPSRACSAPSLAAWTGMQPPTGGRKPRPAARLAGRGATSTTGRHGTSHTPPPARMTRPGR